MATIVLNLELHKLIELHRTTLDETQVEIITRVLKNSNNELKNQNSVIEPKNSNLENSERELGIITKGLKCYVGDKLKMEYGGSEFRAEVVKGGFKLGLDGKIYKSLSRMSCVITKTSRNGWNDWYLLRPNENVYFAVDFLRVDF